MVYLIFDRITEKEAEERTGRKYVEFPDQQFLFLSECVDLNKDETFIKYLREVDKCDIPMPNVARDLITGKTHSFDKVSTGVRMLWLMRYHADKFLFPSQFLGQNCYQGAFDIGRINDVYIYDDSNMLEEEESDECDGVFTDYLTGDIIETGDDRAFDYFVMRGY